MKIAGSRTAGWPHEGRTPQRKTKVVEDVISIETTGWSFKPVDGALVGELAMFTDELTGAMGRLTPTLKCAP